MLRDEQVDLRKARGLKGQFRIENLGRNRVFSDYSVFNPNSKSTYRVSIRGFQPGETFCQCPDFQTNTLGTCKHVEAVLAAVYAEAKGNIRLQHAPVVRPEIYLRYDAGVRLAIRLTPRPSHHLTALANTFFDSLGNWRPGGDFQACLTQLEKTPEEVTVYSDARLFISQELERIDMAAREEELRRLYHNDQWQPDLLKSPLLDYQVEGVFFLAHRGRCILADDMGLGKTRQALAAAELLFRERNVSRVLVITPATLLYPWLEEIRDHSFRAGQVVVGKPRARKALYNQETFFRLIGYDTAREDLEILKAWEPDLVILDEAQRIKNWESLTTRAIKKLHSRFAFVLTGTPLENNLEELYSIIQFIDPRRLGPAFQFLHDHRQVDGAGQVVGYKELKSVREKLSPILLRRTRDEVCAQLPPLNIEDLRLEMAPGQKKAHDRLFSQLARLAHRGGSPLSRDKGIFRLLAAMRLICSGVSAAGYPAEEGSPKLRELTHRLLELLRDDNHKILVFSEWEQPLRQAAARVKEAGADYVFLHGKLPIREREKVTRKFREDNSCRVFLSTDTGGVGLNLQFADTVFNLELPWNPAVHRQRIARVHRMGQTRPVQVYNFIMADSIEERVAQAQVKKAALFESLFSGQEMGDNQEQCQWFLQEIRGWTTSQDSQDPATVSGKERVKEVLEFLAQADLGPADWDSVFNSGERTRLGKKLLALAKDLLGKAKESQPRPSEKTGP